jgi:hypothetical protein
MYVANDLSDSLQQKYRKLLQDVDIRHEIQGEVFNGKWGIEQRTSDEGITKAKTVWRVICRDQEGKECHNLVEPDRKDPLRPKDLFGIFSSEGSETGDSLVLPSWLRDHTQMYKSIQAAKRSIKSYQVKKERARQAQADASEEVSLSIAAAYQRQLIAIESLSCPQRCVTASQLNPSILVEVEAHQTQKSPARTVNPPSRTG